MILVQTMFFDSDDYQVDTNAIPCDTKETAKAIVEKIYEKTLEHNYSFDDENKRKIFEEENVTRKPDGSIYINGKDCGYARIDIIDKEPISMDDVPNFKPEVASFY